MMNIHVFHHRFPALATAVFASLALTFVAIAGTTCSFLNVEASDGRFVEFTTDVPQESVTSASFGVLCETYYFDSDGDTMWNISQIFLYISLALGGIAVALAWTITWCVPPNTRTWKTLSVLSALTAVLNIPIFLLFESEPCTIDSSRQKCSLSFGSFLLMSGAVSSIAVVLLTQCMDTPTWGRELDAWKVGKREREESAERLSRGVVASDEYAGSERKDPEDPPPEAGAETVAADAAAPAVATVGLIEGFRRWRERQKWARSSDLKQTGTTPSSHDDEENVPFAGAGSYYANSNNSRLLLKVTPEGKLPNDEQESMVSFGDLDDYVKMVEDGKLDDSISVESVEEFMEKDPEGILTEAEVTEAPAAGGAAAGVAVGTAAGAAAMVILSQDESEPKTLSTATTDGKENFADEPQFYSEMKAPPSVKEDKGLLETDGSEEADDEDDGVHESKLSRGIRSLTSRVVHSTSRRTKSGKLYTMMDEDDASGISSVPTGLVEDGEPDDAGRESATDDESSSRVRSPSDTDHLHHQTLLFDWNALHAAANAGILLAAEQHSDGETSDEDEPAQVSYTSDDSFGPGSSSSLGNLPDDEEEDALSAFSASSISDISDKDDDDDLVLGEGVTARKDKKRSPPRMSPRKSRRDYSSSHSISSYTSVLDMTIDEETDMDLKEFESSEEDKDSIQASGYKSAPDTIGGDRKLPPYTFIQSESLPASGERGYIVSKSGHLDSLSLDSSHDHELVTPDTTASQIDTSMDTSASLISTETPEEVDDKVDEAAYHSDGSVERGRKISDVADDSDLRFRRSRSISLPKRRKGSSVHPLVTPPISPESGTKNVPWREERLYKGGIHSVSSHIMSDSETSEELYMSEASAKSNMSRRARNARMRRLQSEKNTQRQRSRSLNPPKARRRYDRQTITYDGVPESHSATLNRLLFGSDHGPEEASL